MRQKSILLVVAAVLVAPGCGVFSYELARIETDDRVDARVLDDLRVGQARFQEAVKRLGPPDRVSFAWDSRGRRTTRFEFVQVKGRSSDMTVHVPRQEVATYNSGVRFLLVFLRAMRGQSVVPSELESLAPAAPGNRGAASTVHRLSEMKLAGSTDGRGVRLSDLRESAQSSATTTGDGPVRPFSALALEGSASGRDVLRLEFDEEGVLILKEYGQGAPQTDLSGQIRESVLQ
jgi:hypothetical protein